MDRSVVISARVQGTSRNNVILVFLLETIGEVGWTTKRWLEHEGNIFDDPT